MMNDEHKIAYSRFKKYARAKYYDMIESEDVAQEMFIIALESERRGKFEIIKQRYSWLYRRAVRKITCCEKKTRPVLEYVEVTSLKEYTYDSLMDFLEENCCDTFADNALEMPTFTMIINGARTVTFTLNDIRDLLKVPTTRKDSELINQVKRLGFRLYKFEESFYRNSKEIVQTKNVKRSQIFNHKLVEKFEFRVVQVQ